MSRLFWKIFLSFWVALVLFAGSTILAASLFIERVRDQHGGADPLARIAVHAMQGQAVADAGGERALRRWLQAVDHREIVPLLLLDERGEDLLGRAVSDGLAERIARRARRPPRPPPPAGRDRRARPVIHLPDGTRLRLVPDFQSITLGRVLGRPRVFALPLVLATLVGGLLCLLLARYLTAPVQRLRAATEKLAAGDLSQRVGAGMGRRRDEIADLGAAFDHMAERLEALMGAQHKLLANVSHELRSPLARLQVALELARRRAAGAAEPELDRIEREAERLDALIARLLTLSRLESGARSDVREPVDLAALVEAVVRDAAFEARGHGRDVEVVHTQSASVLADPALLHSALENVVRNAVRYTGEGTTVQVSLAPAPRPPGGWLVRVRDHGPGVPPALLPRLFEPFLRAESGRGREAGGFGLGLAIAERAVRQYGGGMVAENHPDGGLDMRIHLPAAERA